MNLSNNESQSKLKSPDTCLHIPAKTWKNCNPTKSEFTCEKCGKQIYFSPETKNKVNVLTLTLSVLILFPIIISEKVNPFIIGLLALLVLVTAIAIQLFFVKRGHFILKDQNNEKRLQAPNK